ncbi:MAG: hypothetical protein AABW73_00345 [Nanoarchaeota archaeon]
MVFEIKTQSTKFVTIKKRLMGAKEKLSEEKKEYLRNILPEGYMAGSWARNNVEENPKTTGVVRGNYESSVEVAAILGNFKSKEKALLYEVALFSYISGYDNGDESTSSQVDGLLAILE